MADPTTFVKRALLVKARTERLVDEARLAHARGDYDRVEVLRDEMDICLRSLHEIREEQLLDGMTPPAKRRRWWERVRRG